MLSPQKSGDFLDLISQAKVSQVEEQTWDLWHFDLSGFFVMTEVKSALTNETGLKNTSFPLSLHKHTPSMCVRHLHTSRLFVSFFSVLSLNLTCFVFWVCPRKRRGGGHRRENEGIACVQTDITLLKAKQICVCACPVILLLTCALTVGIWDPGNDWGR